MAMIDVCLLGTGGTVPLPNRWLTSLLVKWSGHELLVDCGEGTQIALNAQSLSCRHIDTILLTHYHTDHTAGLPGLLLSMAKAERTEPVTIYGPKGIEEILKGVYLLARYIPFEIRYVEIRDSEYTFEVDGLQITSFHVRHSVPCLGYSFYLKRNPKFDREKAEALNIPIRSWGLLQKGETVEVEGKTYTPDMVLGEERKGIHFVYTTDTRPTPSIKEHSKDADLMIAEGMYGDVEKSEKATLNKHMTMQECADIASQANVKELWFTHYSPSMHDPYIYEEDMKKIFSNCVISKDGEKKTLSFEE